MFARTATLGPDERVSYDVDFPSAGVYTVSASLDDGRSTNYEWELRDADPDGSLTAIIREGEPITFTHGVP